MMKYTTILCVLAAAAFVAEANWLENLKSSLSDKLAKAIEDYKNSKGISVECEQAVKKIQDLIYNRDLDIKTLYDLPNKLKDACKDDAKKFLDAYKDKVICFKNCVNAGIQVANGGECLEELKEAKDQMKDNDLNKEQLNEIYYGIKEKCRSENQWVSNCAVECNSD